MNDAMKTHGAFSWNELATTDIDGAKKFYAELFGWTLSDMPMDDMTYTVAKAGDKEIAGLMSMPPECGDAPPHWGAYVTVDDVDASTAQAESLGATVTLTPRDIPEVGRFSVIQDPQGASLALITYVDGCKDG